MRNYRGGERAMSNWGQSLVKAIENEDTKRQRDRNFREKLIMGGIQAGLTGARGVADSAYRANQQADKDVAAGKVNPRSQVSQDAFKALSNDTSGNAQDNYTKSREFLKGTGKAYNQSGPQDYKSNDQITASRDTSLPSWLTATGEGDLARAAKLAKANRGLNDAASQATLGGYTTADGFMDRDQNSSALAQDQTTAMQGLDQAQALPNGVDTGWLPPGGMMSSLPRQTPMGPLASFDPNDPGY